MEACEKDGLSPEGRTREQINLAAMWLRWAKRQSVAEDNALALRQSAALQDQAARDAARMQEDLCLLAPDQGLEPEAFLDLCEELALLQEEYRKAQEEEAACDE